MATQAEIDAQLELWKLGLFDQVRANNRANHDELYLDVGAQLLVNIDAVSSPTHLENLAIGGSWNLQFEPAENFGGLSTHLFGVPTGPGESVVLPVTGLFVPTEGYEFQIKNGSLVDELIVSADGGKFGGADFFKIEAGGNARVVFEGVPDREYSIISTSAMARTIRFPLAQVDTPGGLFAIENPTGIEAMVSVIVRITTSTPGWDASFGAAPDAITIGSDLIDDESMDGNPVISSPSPVGGPSDAQAVVFLPAGDFITGSTTGGTAAGTAGFIYIRFQFA